jgi:hypothetical protein
MKNAKMQLAPPHLYYLRILLTKIPPFLKTGSSSDSGTGACSGYGSGAAPPPDSISRKV